MEQQINENLTTVLPPNHGGGPLGLGDPNDRTLRKVETEIMIPKKMREKARIEKCFSEVQNFEDCCKGAGIRMVLSCRKENSALKQCLTKWYQNEEFKKQCMEEYLNQRAMFRMTGEKQFPIKKESTSF